MRTTYEADREFYNGNRFSTMATAYSNGVVCEDCVDDEPEDMTDCKLYMSTCKFCGERVAVSTISKTTV